MAYFNPENGYLNEAWKCLIDTEPGTPVNDSKFTKPGNEMDHFEYLYVLRVAEVTHNVWIAASVYAQHYHWRERRGLWVSDEAFANTAKLCDDCFAECVTEAMESKWIVAGADWKTSRKAWFPAIGQSD